MYILNGLVNKLINQKQRLEQDNKVWNEHCRVIGVRNKELEEKNNFKQSLQTRIVDLTNQGNDWKKKFEQLKHDYDEVMEDNIKSMMNEFLLLY